MSKNTPERRARRAAKAAEALKAQQAAERKRKITVGAIVAAVIAVIIGGGFAIAKLSDSSGEPARDVPVVASGDTAGDLEGELDGFGVVLGDPEASDVVTIYEDLQCPACANFEAAAGESLNTALEAGKIRIDYRLVSFLDRASTNEYSSRAMNALLTVLEEAGPAAFKALHDDLYANQPAEGGAGFDDDELVERAVAAGAEEEAIRGAIEDKVYDQWITNATDQMSKDGVSSTPTVRINGEDSTPEALLQFLAE